MAPRQTFGGTMAAYLIGTVRISDAGRFALYGQAIKGLAAEFGGEPIVAGQVTEVLEGDPSLDERVVVTRFATAEQARAYLNSPRYVSAKAARSGAATVQLRLIIDAS